MQDELRRVAERRVLRVQRRRAGGRQVPPPGGEKKDTSYPKFVIDANESHDRHRPAVRRAARNRADGRESPRETAFSVISGGAVSDR